MNDYLHGIEVIEITEPPAVTSVNPSAIGLVGTLKKPVQTQGNDKGNQEKTQIKNAEGKTDKTLYLIKSIQDFDTQFGEQADSTGTLYHAVRDVFSQSAAEIVISVMEGTDKKTAIELLANAPSQLKVTPKILIAPELDDNLEGVIRTANELIKIAKQLKSIALIDLIKEAKHTTDTVFISAVKSLSIEKSDRLYLLYPQLLVKRVYKKTTEQKESNRPAANTEENNIGENAQRAALNIEQTKRQVVIAVEETLTRPASSFVAGLIVKSDTERGFWYSPSNYAFSNLAGVATQIPFFFGEKECLANQLNAANINTIIWQDSYRLWGNKSYTTTSQHKFLSVRRIADVLNRSLLEAHSWAIDQNITKNLKDSILDSVNNYLRKLKMQGAIINGQCWAEPEKNTEASLKAGELYFCFDFTPPYPAERITFTSLLTDKYIKEVLS